MRQLSESLSLLPSAPGPIALLARTTGAAWSSTLAPEVRLISSLLPWPARFLSGPAALPKRRRCSPNTSNSRAMAGHAPGAALQSWAVAAARHRSRLPLVAAGLTALALFLLLLCLAPGSQMGASLGIRAALHRGGSGSGYRSAAAAALMPALVRREEQLALERRWGVQPVLEPQDGWGMPGMKKIPRILHHGATVSRRADGDVSECTAGPNRLPTADRACHAASPPLGVT